VNIVLGWPPSALSPNSRTHWRKKAPISRAYREAAAWATKEAGAVPKFADVGPITLNIEFVPPDRRARDMDNMLSSIKSGLDGISDAIKINDRRFIFRLAQSDEIGGMVRIRISEYVQLVRHV
jgi:crossover junction endodeoxyribonuclease RusA